MKKFAFVFGILAVLFLNSVSFAQKKPEDVGKENPPVKTEEAADNDPIAIPGPNGTTTINSVFVVINKENVAQWLVVGDNGEWLVDVKEIKLNLVIGQKEPTVDCITYRGIFRPTEPETKTWSLSKVTMSTKEEFQEVVDSLSKNRLPKVPESTE